MYCCTYLIRSSFSRYIQFIGVSQNRTFRVNTYHLQKHSII